MSAHIDVADCIAWAEAYDGPPFHALLCDPPYELGFMGRAWDRSGIAFNPDTWRALARVLHPGAFGMAFASSRGWHRLACAIEDAGLIIHPSIFGWAFGSGFPKATRIDTAIDKAAGAVREVVGVGPYATRRPASRRVEDGGEAVDWHYGDGQSVTAPATELAAAWAGHRYGLQALKPALEPIVVFSKSEDPCYNYLREAALETASLVEELWTLYADNAESIGRAAGVVNTALSNALGLTSATTCLGSSSGAADAGRSSTKPRQSCDATAGSGGGTAPGHATASIAPNSPSEPVCNAAGDSPCATLSAPASIAVDGVQMPPASAPCWMTPSEMGIDTATLADMLRSNLARAEFGLSTIWLWSIAWAAVCERVNKSTTATASSTTTELKILSFILRKLMSESRDTVSAKSGSSILPSLAGDAARSLVGLMAIPVDSSPTATVARLSPIIVFQKPYAGRPVDSIVATGAGALNVDGGRVPTGDNLNGGTYGGERRPGTVDVFASTNSMRNGAGEFVQPAGRWPANLVLCHTPDCVRVGERRVPSRPAFYGPRKSSGGILNGTGETREQGPFYADADGLESVAAYACAPGCPVAALGAQSGELKPRANRGPSTSRVDDFGFTSPHACGNECNHNDTGTAARFFHNPDFALDIAERLAAAEPVRYAAKASRSERSAGLPDGERSNHPTVKPLALARHLATLLLPPDAYAPRRLFVPFAGSGSEAIGAMLAGWDEVVGVELSDEYADIARARLAWWAAQQPDATQPALPLAAHA